MKELETLWWDWLSTAERLTRTLHEQTAALTLRQVERIEKLQPEMESLMQRMAEIDDRAAASARKLAEELGCEPNLRSLVGVLDKPEAQAVQALANRVIVAGRNIQEIIAKNKALIENELEYVNGTLALVAREATESPTAYPKKRRQATMLVDQAA
jgi:flagellar biosynthesis/type III secretory pathway chaperone